MFLNADAFFRLSHQRPIHPCFKTLCLSQKVSLSADQQISAFIWHQVRNKYIVHESALIIRTFTFGVGTYRLLVCVNGRRWMLLERPLHLTHKVFWLYNERTNVTVYVNDVNVKFCIYKRYLWMYFAKCLGVFYYVWLQQPFVLEFFQILIKWSFIRL